MAYNIYDVQTGVRRKGRLEGKKAGPPDPMQELVREIMLYVNGQLRQSGRISEDMGKKAERVILK